MVTFEDVKRVACEMVKEKQHLSIVLFRSVAREGY